MNKLEEEGTSVAQTRLVFRHVALGYTRTIFKPQRNEKNSNKQEWVQHSKDRISIVDMSLCSAVGWNCHRLLNAAHRPMAAIYQRQDLIA